MRKYFITAVLLTAGVCVFAACPENGQTCEVKMPDTNFDSFASKKKEADKEDKEVNDMAENYKKASGVKEKTAAKEKLQKAVAARLEKKLARERQQLNRQKEKLALWEKTLEKQEADKARLAEKETEDIITGKAAQDPWKDIKAKAEDSVKTNKKKAVEKAAEKSSK